MNQTSEVVNVGSRASKVNHEEFQAKFREDEEDLIVRIYNLIGGRWSLIAGRIPGRTAEEIEKYWKSKYANSG
ncbi:Transcription factor CPC [Apostasia shenzhenica]|uniref:Transcription factor CPC n=1 Tax=Apostasia shenzhenica TaxID=1088818 RepID=A0A2I0AAM2_9ASPA|nr:Transcription factor CPC [Apostasia shenzhenica]